MHSITAQYNGDEDNLASTSAAISETISKSDISASLIGPASATVVTGMPTGVHDRLRLTAGNEAVNGLVGAVVVLSTDEGVDGSELTLASVSSTLKLTAGQGKTFNLRLPKTIPSTVPTTSSGFPFTHSGVYHVLIELTDAAGNEFTLDSGQIINVAAPSIDVDSSLTKFPATVTSEKPFLITVEITNSNASVSAKGVLQFGVNQSTDGALDEGSVLVSRKRHIDLRPNKSFRITFKLTLKQTMDLVGVIDLDGLALGGSGGIEKTFIQHVIVE